MLFSHAVTEGIGYSTRGGWHMKLDFIDVRRAYSHADARRTVYVELQAEDKASGMCGRLVKSMYGTRDAAQNWEFAYSEFMISVGFIRWQGSPCVFFHLEKNIRAVIHGDDFTLLATEKSLDWFRQVMTEKFEVKFRGWLGPEKKDDKAIRILNRIVQWDDQGISYEADQRHAEIIITHQGLDSESKAVVTPGEKDLHIEEDDDQELEGGEATNYRAMTARGIYMSQDRTDIQSSVKELARHMAKPRKSDRKRLKRLGRYLIGREIRHKI
jgi:hypothetical protein